MDLKYTRGTASEQEIYSHLLKCNKHFIPPLEMRVSIEEYSAKIFEKAVNFEAWSGDTLVGLLAAYFNDPNGRNAFITSVSTIATYMGRGIASTLINLSIDYARQHGFKTISLEVAKANERVVDLYRKLGFVVFENEGDFIIMKLGVGES